MSNEIPQQLNYKLVDQYSPKYRFLKLSLNNLTGSQIDNITASSGNVIEFRLPPQVFNLSRSILSFKMRVGEQGSGNYAILPIDCLAFADKIEFGLGGGMNLCDVNYYNNYSKVARKIGTKLDEFMSSDVHSRLFASDERATKNLRLESITAPAEDPYGFPTGASYQAVKNYTEEKHFIAGDGNDVFNDYNVIPLGAFKDTIYEVDKDVYFPFETYVRIQVPNANKMGFASTLAANPSSGAAALVDTGAAGYAIRLTDIHLYLAVEKNEVLVNSLIEKYKRGDLTMQIPYLAVFRNTISTADASVQVQLTKQYGKHLKYITNMVTNSSTETLTNMYNIANYNGAIVTHYSTHLNSQPLQDSELYCYLHGHTSLPISTGVGLDDWRENAQFCKGTVIQDAGQYQMNWFHRNSFVTKKNENEDDNVVDGLSMEEYPTLIYQFNATLASAASRNYYVFACFSRQFRVVPEGFVWV